MYNKYKYRDAILKRCIDKNIPNIRGNFSQLGQVCINIIQNAIQAVPENNGEVILETGAKNNHLYFRCQDNGGGIPKDKLPHIFQPFFTTKPVGEGTGLGLYVCHDIITKHQGQIHVYNNEKGGATFEITLPLSQSALVA